MKQALMLQANTGILATSVWNYTQNFSDMHFTATRFKAVKTADLLTLNRV